MKAIFMSLEREKKKEEEGDALVILRTIAVFLLPLCQFVDLAYKNKNFNKILFNKLLYFI